VGMRRFFLLLVSGLVLIPAAGSASSGPDATLDAALARLVALHGGPPAAVAIVQRGRERVIIRQGIADRTSGRPVSLDDRWRLASVSKAFSGALALRLAARGRLSLDDTIGRGLPHLPAAWRKVTLAEALQHTSGLPDFTKNPKFQRAVRANPRRSVRPITLIRYVKGRPLRFRPGSKYSYSNTDNVVVGLFVRSATGHSYRWALRHRVLRPLGLVRTALPFSYRMPSPYVHGYEGDQDVSELLNPTLAWASGGLVSTPGDLTRFIRAYAGGKLFRGPARRRQLRFRPGESDPAGPGRNGAGLGIFRYRTRCGTLYGHTGSFPGYTAFAAASRNGARSVVIQVSTQIGPRSESRLRHALRHVFVLGACAALEH
jgi:D-alanyl-D-alanine carboxypeptidase